MDEKAPPENVQGQVIAVCLSEYKGERKKRWQGTAFGQPRT